jgi:hypothetical protein
MSQQDDTLRQGLRQQLDNIVKVNESTDCLRDLVEWLVQELWMLSSPSLWLLSPMNGVKIDKVIATATANGIFSHEWAG